MKAINRFASFGTCLIALLANVVGASGQVNHSFSVTVISVDAGITEIIPTDFFAIAFSIDPNKTDQNNSIGGGNFPALAISFSLMARPLNSGTWHPMGTFDLDGSNYVTNAFGNNFTIQMRGNGFPAGGTGLPFFDLDLDWKWPGDLTDSGANDSFGQQFGGTFDPSRAVLRRSAIRFLAGPGDFREAAILPVTPTLAGDYNADGVVDAADYVEWRKFPPGPGILLNDATPGSISGADYTVWRNNFGKVLGSGTGSVAATAAQTPEPGSLALIASSMLVVAGPLGRSAAAKYSTHRRIR